MQAMSTILSTWESTRLMLWEHGLEPELLCQRGVNSIKGPRCNRLLQEMVDLTTISLSMSVFNEKEDRRGQLQSALMKSKMLRFLFESIPTRHVIIG